MKKITLSLLAASSLLFGFNDYYDSHDSTDSQTYVGNQVVVNNIVADAPKTDFITSGKSFGAGAQYINAGDISIVNIPIGVKIGGGFGVEVNAPIVKNSSGTNDESGIGDVSAGMNYNFGTMFDTSGLNVITVLYKSTTGDVDKGLGTDKGAISMSYKLDKSLSSKFNIHGLLSYTLNDEEVSGNSTMAMIGGSMPCLLTNKVTTSAKLTYFNVGENKYKFGKLNSADLWLQWNSSKLVSNVPLGFGVKIPFINEVDDNDIDKTVVFYLSVASFF